MVGSISGERVFTNCSLTLQQRGYRGNHADILSAIESDLGKSLHELQDIENDFNVTVSDETGLVSINVDQVENGDLPALTTLLRERGVAHDFFRAELTGTGCYQPPSMTYYRPEREKPVIVEVLDCESRRYLLRDVVLKQVSSIRSSSQSEKEALDAIMAFLQAPEQALKDM